MAGSDVNVQEIAKWILSTYADDGFFEAHASTIPILQDEVFTKRLKSVIYANQIVLRRRWTAYMEDMLYDILISHETYVLNVFFACRMEEYLHLNIFERFLVVCGIAILFCIDIQYFTTVKMDTLTLDLIMEYYEKQLKKSFNKRGGLKRLVEYIGRHKFSKWGMAPNLLPSCNRIEAERIIRNEILESLDKEFLNQSYQLFSGSNKRKEMGIARSLAREFLSTTRIELPLLPNRADLEEKIRKRKEDIQRKLDEVEQEPNIATGFVHPAFLQQISSDSAAKEYASEEGKMEDSAERQQTEVEQNMDHLEEAVQGLSISNSDCKSKLDVKLSEFEEAKVDTATERKPTVEMTQRQQDTDEGMADLQISNPGSEPNEEVEQEKNNARSQNAEEIIRSKDPKRSRNWNFKRSNQMQLIETLEHLNGNIKSLIEVLDQYDKE